MEQAFPSAYPPPPMPAVLAGIPPGNAVFDPFKDLSGLAAGKVGFSLDGLNDRQKEAITFLDSPIMVFAGPGSGKTRVLTFRVAYLLDAGVAEEPFQVLALTFTNKAADEMNDRIEKLIGSLKGRVWAGTFHSLCHRILRAYGPYISLAPNFTIVDDADRMEMIQDCLERARLLNRIPPMQALDEIGRFKNEMILPEQLASDPSSGRRAMGAVFADYQKRLANNGMIDFDDLMLLTIRLFQEHPTLCRIYQDAFPHILIDEYQDTNVAQMELLKLLAVRTRSLCAVADDDQSIYCWRGAQPQNIRAFIEHFGAEKVYLEKNHRSPQPIIDAAIAVVERNSSHEEKQLYGNPPREEFCIFGHLAGTMEKEAAFVAREIRGLLDAGCSPQEIAILFRTRHNSLFVLEQELVKAGVPCTRAGRDYSAPQQDLKGMADYLHIIHSEHNSRALRRVLASGLSKDDLNALGRFYRDCKYRHLFDALGDIHELESFQGEKADFCRKIYALVRDLRHEEAQPSFLLRRLARRLESDFPLESSASDSRRKSFENLIRQAEETERRLPLSGLTEFLSSVILTPDTISPAEGENTVRLLTIHGAKGLEWQYVFLVALEEGILPHYRAKTQTEIEEERRSFYVAMTRTKERLYLSCAGEREYGKEQRAVRKQSPSRFLEEIPKGLIRILEDTERSPLPLL